MTLAAEPVRLVCIGDTHGRHRELKMPAGDVLIHSSDFMGDGSSVEEIDDFNSWLGSLPSATRSSSRAITTGSSTTSRSWRELTLLKPSTSKIRARLSKVEVLGSCRQLGGWRLAFSRELLVTVKINGR